ncbi:MAG: flippase-like domain-containing protein [Bacteroidales bacterium]|nr:flippase-like domain-containing protein [Bacteroidales bacterium]MDD5788554.1 lysylphosphatidylglycerol synthase transmembrane domain-containing protein [Bacteroidales bacterium]MDY2692446.1 lysylphosphatidylglycerol synthase transmembrane domain-containing protein [Prevotella sp.]MDY4731817.1 lysylphosphatidylglycerol synthase transmembrane domain-containing protein [Prevotella sp.]MDY6027005.1 lysylphosphatidylglycerol synthase transmembrane domain-containing protein [Prevotella sp.]
MRNITIQSAKIALPLVLGGAILFWMYRDFDFEHIEKVLAEEMNWSWMLLSFPFGILAQMFRGWRWKQTLEPIGESPRKATAIHAVFLSYAASLVVPRIGEFTRCGVLRRYDGVSFAKALGTVVTERAIDTLLMGVLALLTLLMQMDVFTTFFTRTGTSVDAVIHKFSTMGYVVTAICGVAVLLLLHFLLRKLSLYNKVKATVGGIWQGIISLRAVNNIPLFVFYTLGIWVSYFLHYYLTFFCFDFTATLGLECALVTFVVGSIAVIVPTPNGAGPWHFAVKTMLILYGVADVNALYFVLIVHTVQTMLVIALGVYSWVALAFTKIHKKKENIFV